jgi:hypothetical protein
MRRRLSCEGSAGPLRRGVQALHTVLLFRLSPKWGMNLYAAVGIAEVWRYTREGLTLSQLLQDGYVL